MSTTTVEPVTTPTADFNKSTSSDVSSDEIRLEIQKQFEYYFSSKNLLTDTYLLSQMDQEAYVPVALISQFKRIKQLTNDMDLITSVIQHSSQLQLDPLTSLKVRSIGGLNGGLITIPTKKLNIKKQPDLAITNNSTQRCVIIMREVSPSAQLDQIKSLFVDKEPSCPPCDQCESAGNDSWYITFSNEDNAQRALQYLKVNVQTFLDKPIRARIKAHSQAPVSTRPPPTNNVTSNSPMMSPHTPSIVYPAINRVISASPSTFLSPSSSPILTDAHNVMLTAPYAHHQPQQFIVQTPTANSPVAVSASPSSFINNKHYDQSNQQVAHNQIPPPYWQLSTAPKPNYYIIAPVLSPRPQPLAESESSKSPKPPQQDDSNIKQPPVTETNFSQQQQQPFQQINQQHLIQMQLNNYNNNPLAAAAAVQAYYHSFSQQSPTQSSILQHSQYQPQPFPQGASNAPPAAALLSSSSSSSLSSTPIQQNQASHNSFTNNFQHQHYTQNTNKSSTSSSSPTVINNPPTNPYLIPNINNLSLNQNPNGINAAIAMNAAYQYHQAFNNAINTNNNQPQQQYFEIIQPNPTPDDNTHQQHHFNYNPHQQPNRSSPLLITTNQQYHGSFSNTPPPQQAAQTLSAQHFNNNQPQRRLNNTNSLTETRNNYHYQQYHNQRNNYISRKQLANTSSSSELITNSTSPNVTMLSPNNTNNFYNNNYSHQYHKNNYSTHHNQSQALHAYNHQNNAQLQTQPQPQKEDLINKPSDSLDSAEQFLPDDILKSIKTTPPINSDLVSFPPLLNALPSDKNNPQNQSQNLPVKATTPNSYKKKQQQTDNTDSLSSQLDPAIISISNSANSIPTTPTIINTTPSPSATKTQGKQKQQANNLNKILTTATATVTDSQGKLNSQEPKSLPVYSIHKTKLKDKAAISHNKSNSNRSDYNSKNNGTYSNNHQQHHYHHNQHQNTYKQNNYNRKLDFNNQRGGKYSQNQYNGRNYSRNNNYHNTSLTEQATVAASQSPSSHRHYKQKNQSHNSHNSSTGNKSVEATISDEEQAQTTCWANKKLTFAEILQKKTSAAAAAAASQLDSSTGSNSPSSASSQATTPTTNSTKSFPLALSTPNTNMYAENEPFNESSNIIENDLIISQTTPITSSIPV